MSVTPEGFESTNVGKRPSSKYDGIITPVDAVLFIVLGLQGVTAYSDEGYTFGKEGSETKTRSAPILAGTIVETTGDPVIGAVVGLTLVTLHGTPVRSWHTRSADDGRFEFRQYAEGLARIHVQARGRTPWTRYLTVPAVGELPVVLSRTARIWGRAFSSDRMPLKDVEVVACVNGSTVRARTDDDGVYTLELPYGRLTDLEAGSPKWGRVSRSDRLTESIEPTIYWLDPGDERMEDFVFEGTGEIEGVVVGPDGEPVPKAAVLLYGVVPGRRNVQVSRRTDATDTGSVVFKGLDPGLYQVSAEAKQGTAGSPSIWTRTCDGVFVGEIARVRVFPRARYQVKVKLTPWAAIRGRVVDPDALGIGGVSIVIKGGSFQHFSEVSANGEGIFEALVDPLAPYEMAVRPPGAAGNDLRFGKYPGIEPGAVEEPVLSYARPVNVRVHIRRADGQPVLGAEVVCSIPEVKDADNPNSLYVGPKIVGTLAAGRTDAGGNYEAWAWPGPDTYVLQILAAAHEPGIAWFDLSSSVVPVSLTVTLKSRGSGALKGTVRSRSGKGIPGCTVTLIRQQTADDRVRRRRLRLVPLEMAAVTDMDGTYCIEGLQEQETYRVTAEAEGYGDVSRVVIQRRKLEDCDFILEPCLEIRGRIVVENGYSAPRGTMVGQTRNAVAVDEEGRFHLRAVPPSVEELGVWGSEIYPGSVEVQDLLLDSLVRVRRRFSFEGRIVEESGKPVPLSAFSLSLFSLIGTTIGLVGSYDLFTDDDGRFSVLLDHVPPGLVKVVIAPSSHVWTESFLPIVLRGFGGPTELKIRRGWTRH